MKTTLSFLKLFLGMLKPDQRIDSEAIPPEQRWWEPSVRQTSSEEAERECRHCGKPFGIGTVKICPQCKVILHSACYDDTEGGRAYATPECSACWHRTYWR